MKAGKTGASLNRGGSKQDYRTPRIFLDACERRFGKISFDLAATKKNAVVPRYFSKRDDSLTRDWTKLRGLLWLNPPFDTITPWAEKCRETFTTDWPHTNRVTGLLFLVPASVGSEWFFEHVHNAALVLPLRQRLSFDGKNPYPKDLMLCAYGVGEIGFAPWKWREQWP